MEMAKGAEAQQMQTAQVATAMEEMSAMVREISSNSNRAAVSARQASDVAREGGTIVEDALGRMQSIAEKVQDASLQVSELGSRSDQIGKIVPTSPNTVTVYNVPTASSQPNGIALGPDGNIWFTEYNAGKIGEITPGGTITEYTLPAGSASGPRPSCWWPASSIFSLPSCST